MIRIIGCRTTKFLGFCFAWAVLSLVGGGGVFLSATVAAAEPLKVVVPPWAGAGAQNEYFVRLLALAFLKTEAAEGPVEIQAYPEQLTGARFVADLKNNKTVNVMWHGTNVEREQDLIAVPISLTKDLNEYRVLLIRKADQGKFNKVHSIEDLRNFTAGSASDWPSKDILRQNDLPVLTVANWSLLKGMLKMKRFDYMSRNIFEVWDEAARYEKDGLVVEQTLLLHGGVPFYFFVSKANADLAARIERGLRIAIADGSFEQLFLSIDGFRRGELELKAGNRRLLRLNMDHASASSSLPSKK
jgi:hypothetical protein